MPAKKSQKKTNGKKKIAWAITLGVIIILLACIWYAVQGQYLVEQRKMEAYLREKYGESFIVDNAHLTGSGLGVKGAVVASAHPRNDSTLRFEINKIDSATSYSHDTYLQTLWSRQESAAFNAFLENSSITHDSYLVTVIPDKDIYDSVKGAVPTFNSIKLTFPRNISYIVSIKSTVDIKDDEPSKSRLDDAYHIVKHFQDANIPGVELHYLYKSVNYSEADNNGQPLYQCAIDVSSADMPGVSSANDLKRYYERIR